MTDQIVFRSVAVTADLVGTGRHLTLLHSQEGDPFGRALTAHLEPSDVADLVAWLRNPSEGWRSSAGALEAQLDGERFILAWSDHEQASAWSRYKAHLAADLLENPLVAVDVDNSVGAPYLPPTAVEVIDGSAPEPPVIIVTLPTLPLTTAVLSAGSLAQWGRAFVEAGPDGRAWFRVGDEEREVVFTIPLSAIESASDLARRQDAEAIDVYLLGDADLPTNPGGGPQRLGFDLDLEAADLMVQSLRPRSS